GGHHGQFPHGVDLTLAACAPAAPHQAGEQHSQGERGARHDEGTDEVAVVHWVTLPSRAVIRPRSSVAVTVAGNVIDSNGVLADLLANPSPLTVQVASGSTIVRLAGSPTANGRP